MATKQKQAAQPTYIDKNLDLKLAFETITAKKAPYDLLYAYYKGNHPLKYSTDRLRKAFDKIYVYFAENWIAVIIDAVLDRLNLKGFDIANDAASKRLMELWEQYHIHLMADDVHEAATVVGEGYVIAWKEENDKGEEVTDVYYNDPRMCHVFYDPYRPTEKLYAAKMWIDGKTRHPKMMLYYPDRLEHYISQSVISRQESWISSSGGFQPDKAYGDNGTEPNEYGVIPVFHFRAGRMSGKKEIGQTEISLQDAVNKLFADMMVSSEFYTFTQRVIITNADVGDMKNGPGINWVIPAGDGKGQASSVQELGNKSLTPYLEAIDKLAQALAIISRTPKHYLMLTGSDPSGDALLAMEAPLNKKVKKRMEGYEVEWKSLAIFLLKLEGIDVNAKDVSPVWEPTETIQPKASADTVKTETDSGIPLVTAVRRRGWASDEIKQMEEDMKEQDKRKSGLAQDALNKMRAQGATDNTNPDGTPKKIADPFKQAATSNIQDVNNAKP